MNELLDFFLSPLCRPDLPGLPPTGWFRKGSFGILQSCRELASKQMALPNSLHKSSVPL